MTDEILEQARARWHSDDQIVCLRRALAEVKLFESIEKARKDGTSSDPMDRVFRGLETLARIADALERMAPKLKAPVSLEPEPEPDDDDAPSSEGPLK